MQIARTIVGVIAWFVVLTVGLRVDATALTDSWSTIPLFIIASTVTNVGILAILASLVGDSDDWATSVKRGFVIYVMLISGVVVLFTDSVVSPTQEQYGKIAGTVSLVCVVISYRPELFTGFLDRVAGIFSAPAGNQ